MRNAMGSEKSKLLVTLATAQDASAARPARQTRAASRQPAPWLRPCAAQVDHELAGSLELRVFERPRLIQRPAVPVVADVERPPFDKSLQGQAFTRHGWKSRTKLGESFAL